MNYKQRELKVEQSIHKFCLENCKNARIGSATKVKGISGGEKRRLTFASAAIHDPDIFFADEATTGLDSTSARHAVMTMKAMPHATVLCTIHQPSSEVFGLFDDLLLLADGGRVAYYGPTDGCLPFFKSFGYDIPLTYNPADVYIKELSVKPFDEEASRIKIQEICRAYKENYK